MFLRIKKSVFYSWAKGIFLCFKKFFQNREQESGGGERVVLDVNLQKKTLNVIKNVKNVQFANNNHYQL